MSWLDGVDARTGEIVQRDHPQRGDTYVVVLPMEKGFRRVKRFLLTD
jgi:predicted aconitase with swiveling domain